MTVRLIEQDGKWYAYHAHIVYHGDPGSVDFDPADNSTVEVMAELPDTNYLSGKPGPTEGMPPPTAASEIIQVFCPDPQCGSVSFYPANGDPEARGVHDRYNSDSTASIGTRATSQEIADEAANRVATLETYVANAWARADMGLDPDQDHEHLGVMTDPTTRTIAKAGSKEASALRQKASVARAALAAQARL